MKRCSDSRPVVAVRSHETSWGSANFCITAAPHGGWGGGDLAALSGGLFLPTHPPTEVTPSLRLRPLAGALNRKLLPPNPCCADPGGGSPRPREPFSSIGIVSVISALQRKSRRSSFRPRAPVWGRARRAGGTLKGRRVGLDSKSKQKSSPLAGTAFISCKMENH